MHHRLSRGFAALAGLLLLSPLAHAQPTCWNPSFIECVDNHSRTTMLEYGISGEETSSLSVSEPVDGYCHIARRYTSGTDAHVATAIVTYHGADVRIVNYVLFLNSPFSGAEVIEEQHPISCAALFPH